MIRLDGPRIENQDDAFRVLDELIEDADLEGTLVRLQALRALRHAIERGALFVVKRDGEVVF